MFYCLWLDVSPKTRSGSKQMFDAVKKIYISSFVLWSYGNPKSVQYLRAPAQYQQSSQTASSAKIPHRLSCCPSFKNNNKTRWGSLLVLNPIHAKGRVQKKNVKLSTFCG